MIEQEMEFESEDQETYALIINTKLDDAKLTARAFRIYCHIARRCGDTRKRGLCFASVPGMAAHCDMDERTVASSIAELVSRNMIRREVRAGRSNLITLASPSKWKSPPAEIAPPSKNEGTTPLIKGTYHPPHKMGEEGTPIKGTPFNELHIPPDGSKKSKKPLKETNPNHKVFIELWMERYESKFKFKYTFQGGRDAKCVSELLAGDLDPAGLINIAELAWNRDGYPFNSSRSIVGFKSLFNEIRAGVTSGSKGYPPRNGNGSGPRNDGSSEPMVNVRTIEFK